MKPPVTIASDRPGLTVRVDLQSDGPDASTTARLLDCSRTDAQLIVAHRVSLGERILVRLRDDESGLQLDVAGTVAWQEQENEFSWRIGCRFTQELDWESLGELFLCGILEMTPRSSQRPLGG